jgi:outer membrane protein OmpA-like peptidoglycan-associated protein
MATMTRTVAAISVLTAALLAGCGTANTRSGPSPDRFRGAEGIEIPPGPSEPSWWIDPVIDDSAQTEPQPDQPNIIRATVPADTLFNVGSSDVSPTAEAALGVLHASLGAVDIQAVSLDCHADSTGNSAANQTLSENRAHNLSAWITTHWEIPEDRITTRGHGDTQPAATNDTPTGRAQNRRCEIAITVEHPA